VIAAGLLHDIMDDSYDEYSNKRLAEMFGKEVADLVEGVGVRLYNKCVRL
jgi:(p)ppGpp synthase/HD superfamily hydrolase